MLMKFCHQSQLRPCSCFDAAMPRQHLIDLGRDINLFLKLNLKGNCVRATDVYARMSGIGGTYARKLNAACHVHVYIYRYSTLLASLAQCHIYEYVHCTVYTQEVVLVLYMLSHI